MNNKIFLFASIALFASCTKTNLATGPKTTDSETIKKMTFDVKGAATFSSEPAQLTSDNFDFLGYGYNIIGKYADTSSIRAQVINAAAYAAAYPDRIDFSHTTSGTFHSLNAANAEDYLSKISMQTNASTGLALFKNTITKAFPEPDAISSKYIYAQYILAINWEAIRTYWDNGEEYLTPEFKTDVQNLTPENLVKKYGTHILSEITLGERLNIYFQAKTSDNDKLHSSLVGLTYALQQNFGISSGYLDPLKPAEVNAIFEPKLFYETIGGDPSKINKLTTSKGTITAFNEWISSCTADKAMFVDIGPRGLLPLYDFIEDPIKKAEIKSYITSYIDQNKVKL